MPTPYGHSTPMPYSQKESEQILTGITTDSDEIWCPRCNRALSSDYPIGGRCHTPEFWVLHCPACSRYTLVPDFPA